MSTGNQLREAAARCFSILRRYHNAEKSAGSRALMEAEVATLVGWLIELDLAEGLAEARVLDPVEEFLVARYGHEAGRRLNGEFIEAFESTGMGLISRP